MQADEPGLRHADFGFLDALNTCPKALDQPFRLKRTEVIEDGSIAKGIGRDAVQLHKVQRRDIEALEACVDMHPHRIQCPVLWPAWRREASLLGRDKDALRCILSHPACNQALGAPGTVDICGIEKCDARCIGCPKDCKGIIFLDMGPAPTDLPATKTNFTYRDAIK